MYIVNSMKVARDKDLLPGARLLMAEIINLNGAPYGCIATNRTLGNYVGVGVRQVQKYLNLLENKGYIEVKEVENKKEQDSSSKTRIIVPTNLILNDMPTAVKNYKKKQNNKVVDDIESDWLDDYIKNFE